MGNQEIRLQCVKVKELYEFAVEASRDAQADDVIPITVHRALAQMKNPYADGDETGLLVARMGSQCIGYIGILPSRLRRGDQLSKIQWLTTWYVAPAFRATGVAQQLLMSAVSTRDTVGTGVSPPAEKVYRRLGFREIGPLPYSILDVQRFNFLALGPRLAQKVLPRLGIGAGTFEPALRLSKRAFDAVGKRVVYWSLMPEESACLAEIDAREVSRIDPVSPGQLNATVAEFYRCPKVINWMLQYKWVLGLEEAGASTANYCFAGVRHLFKYIALNVYSSNDGTYKGFVVFSVSSERCRTVLKVLDSHFLNAEDRKYAFWLAVQRARTHRADAIEFPTDMACYAKQTLIGRLGLRKASRIYFSWPENPKSPLAVSLPEIGLHYCDGDTAFT